MSKPFFHELPIAQIEKEIDGKVTWGEIMEKYDQPTWCNYPDALQGKLGCWSLTIHPWMICEDFCKTCPEYNPKHHDPTT